MKARLTIFLCHKLIGVHIINIYPQRDRETEIETEREREGGKNTINLKYQYVDSDLHVIFRFSVIKSIIYL